MKKEIEKAYSNLAYAIVRRAVEDYIEGVNPRKIEKWIKSEDFSTIMPDCEPEAFLKRLKQKKKQTTIKRKYRDTMLKCVETGKELRAGELCKKYPIDEIIKKVKAGEAIGRRHYVEL